MIEAGGKQFITLSDDMYVNGQKVTAVYVNGTRVYPETSGHGMTCIEALFVVKASIVAYGNLPYLYIDWGDGTTLYRANGSETSSRVTYEHEYDDSNVHKVTISALIEDFGGLEFKAIEIAGPDSGACSSPESYALWCGSVHGVVEPDDPILQYRNRFLQAYAGVMLEWDINPKPPTIGCYISRLSSEHIQTSSTGGFSLEVKFDSLVIFYANKTYISFEGHRLPEFWS